MVHVKPGRGGYLQDGDVPTIEFVTGVGRIKLQGILKKDLGKQAGNLRGRLR